ncbi:MAG: Yip1 family protein [Bacteroidaceae bacterium]
MLLISSPAKAWEEISLEEDKRKVFASFVYPMIGLCGLSVFLGTLIDGWGQLTVYQVAMTKCCAVFVGLFGGYFLAAYAVNKLGVGMFGLKNDIKSAQQFTGYALNILFISYIAWGLAPQFIILYGLSQFYVVYIIWEGAEIIMRVEEKRRMTYTLLTFLLITLSPIIVGIVFNKLTVILN